MTLRSSTPLKNPIDRPGVRPVLPRVPRITRLICATALLFSLSSCVHNIHVTPTPEPTSLPTLPVTVKIEVPFIALEGADHMPGIAMLKWPPEDLRDAIVRYIQQRGSFAGAGSEGGDMILAVKAWLLLRAPDRYVYHVHLEADLSRPGQAPVKTYVADAEALGSSVRWVTASDEEPINTATGTALDRLFSHIESDRGQLFHPRVPSQ